nr:IS200/IS605 family transposase [Jiella mangrovi]
MRETARAHKMIVHAGSINRHHVHMLVAIRPDLSVSRAVKHLKGRSSHKLLDEFGIMRKRYWGQHLWARGYCVNSRGNVTDEVWIDYIKNKTPPEPDDNFEVTSVR